MRNTLKRLESGDIYDNTGLRSGDVFDNTKLKLRIREAMEPLKRVSDVYQLHVGETPCMASREDLEKLTTLYDTNWAILVGLDRSDPMQTTSSARTILTAIAKGLPGSRSDPSMMYDLGKHSYIYFLLHLSHIVSASMDDIKLELSAVHSEYDGIDVIGGERWGLWDLSSWCTDNGILFIPISPNQSRQKEAFTELFQLFMTGLIKAPPVKVRGSKQSDILQEELINFDYNPKNGSYGSLNKEDKNGIQDDVIYSLGWGIWGGKNLSVEDFRPRTTNMIFGEFFKEPVVGRY
jgi:hypothetical protein